MLDRIGLFNIVSSREDRRIGKIANVLPDKWTGLLGQIDGGKEQFMSEKTNTQIELTNRLSKSTLSVLVEPTSFCNMDCLYCYKGYKQHKFMAIETFRKMAERILAYCENRPKPILFVWHGGEPSLVGASFYRKAFTILEEMNCKDKISHTMQTNGTLLTDELLDILSEHQVSIGVSLDGPADYHNRIRPMCNGQPSYEEIVRNLQKAKTKNIDVGILMSITNENSKYIEEVFNYCRENKFTFGLNPITSDLHSDHPSLEVSPETYLNACLQIFDLWFYQDEFSIQVNPPFGVVRQILSQSRLSDCGMSENCQMHFISIGPEGDIYPCNRFYGLTNYRLGNILTQSLNEVFNSPIHQSFLGRAASKIEQCQNCPIIEYCNGGCVHHAIVHYGSLNAPDHLCVVYRGLVEHALDRLAGQLTNIAN